MVDALQGIGDKMVAVIMTVMALGHGVFISVQTAVTPPHQETAVVYSAMAPVFQKHIPLSAPVAISRVSSTAPTSLLPIVLIAKKNAKAVKAPVSTPSPIITTIAVQPVTAQWLLDNTKLSFKQKRDGTYQAIFTASTGGQNLTWGIDDASIGGNGGIPKFSFSVSCDPPFETPAPDLPDQTHFFKVRTSYDCAIGFAAVSGNDQQMRSKNMHIDTGPGQLVVTPPSSMNTVLTNDTNNGGFVFDNQDTQSLTVTKLTLDISYTALTTMDGPLVLRILDPANQSTLADYHMENIAAGSAPYTFAAANVDIPVSFTLQPATPKLLPLQLLGVHRLSILDNDPRVTLTLRAVTLDKNAVPVALGSSEIHWTCVVTLAAYDPNATSGPYASGEACR